MSITHETVPCGDCGRPTRLLESGRVGRHKCNGVVVSSGPRAKEGEGPSTADAPVVNALALALLLVEVLAEFRENTADFSVSYKREPRKLITDQTEDKITIELLKEKTMIEDKTLPIKWYNYSAVRDTLKEKHNITVSVPSIISRANKVDCFV